ncbi:hypothetical protein ISN45_Aa06g039890 [Arabidopsis thaliana x Arabidopsis arenosa]|uniref:Uncharacterized protein n=1 Tax=Arabidopsis thaliana x Arabidopsis arenosa TaxID=1240361 RepID=A0A8T1Z5E8_9BRAS|nr:hypothetical protein ISN45_Aa06g039890 [Arabidopsis thaliana x Arabidopsis arenosa]KAG7553468.1 hypothetical protein ISN45_Aa06g039890 [Arabidopsis thaliana x Arabidopsis arenosa]KAG7553469.1 hypothetical protein ISN45_Aa06g039890 [Arabidopsis thaliana x Arabidopsis arenosa]
MADKDEAATRGNDWEVVSLTASAYAASPGPKPVVDLKDDGHKDVVTPCYEAETSHPLYMSRHFVFPPSGQLEPPPTSELIEASKKMDFGFETGTHCKDEGDLTLKGLDLSDDFGGLEFFDEKGKKDDNIYTTAMTTSLDDERAIGGSHVYELNEPVQEPTEPVPPSDVTPDLNPTKDDDKHEVANVPPCEEAWWKRSAASLIAQAKETNTVWSICIAAAVMGIVILGQHWQQERWQILQQRWESSIGNEKAGRLMGPISRLKQAFVGGQRRDSFIRGSSQNDR